MAELGDITLHVGPVVSGIGIVLFALSRPFRRNERRLLLMAGGLAVWLVGVVLIGLGR